MQTKHLTLLTKTTGATLTLALGTIALCRLLPTTDKTDVLAIATLTALAASFFLQDLARKILFSQRKKIRVFWLVEPVPTLLTGMFFVGIAAAICLFGAFLPKENENLINAANAVLSITAFTQLLLGTILQFKLDYQTGHGIFPKFLKPEKTP